jgi:hypothetical protein
MDGNFFGLVRMLISRSPVFYGTALGTVWRRLVARAGRPALTAATRR